MSEDEGRQVTFAFMVRSLSVWDAIDLINNNPEVDYQLGQIYQNSDHNIEFGLVDAEPGDPVSPVIESAEESVSHMYATFRFAGTPVYMTIPVMATIELGWLERDE
jgi:hypothetical protein